MITLAVLPFTGQYRCFLMWEEWQDTIALHYEKILFSYCAVNCYLGVGLVLCYCGNKNQRKCGLQQLKLK